MCLASFTPSLPRGWAEVPRKSWPGLQSGAFLHEAGLDQAHWGRGLEDPRDGELGPGLTCGAPIPWRQSHGTQKTHRMGWGAWKRGSL